MAHTLHHSAVGSVAQGLCPYPSAEPMVAHAAVQQAQQVVRQRGPGLWRLHGHEARRADGGSRCASAQRCRAMQWARSSSVHFRAFQCPKSHSRVGVSGLPLGVGVRTCAEHCAQTNTSELGARDRREDYPPPRAHPAHRGPQMVASQRAGVCPWCSHSRVVWCAVGGGHLGNEGEQQKQCGNCRGRDPRQPVFPGGVHLPFLFIMGPVGSPSWALHSRRSCMSTLGGMNRLPPAIPSEEPGWWTPQCYPKGSCAAYFVPGTTDSRLNPSKSTDK